MTKNPILNALCAIIYICALVTFLYYGLGEGPDPDSVLIPIMMLSLLVLSVSFMGFTFFYQPIRLYLDGEKEQGTLLAVKTIGTFALITLILMLVVFFVIVP